MGLSGEPLVTSMKGQMIFRNDLLLLSMLHAKYQCIQDSGS